MVQLAGRLSDADELVVVDWGQSNDQPRGTYSQLVAQSPHLYLTPNGYDVAVLTVSGSAVVLTAALTDNAAVGMELRLSWPVYGQATCPTRAGYGVVTANTGTGLTVSWTVAPSIPAANTGGFSFGASNKVTYAGHTYQDGDRVVFSGAPLPAEITAGAVYYVRARAAGDFELSLTLGGAAVAFSTAIAGASIAPQIGAYLHWADGRGLAHPSVRVLTPWMPETFGAYPTTPVAVPGVTFAAGITWESAALLLAWTPYEGVDGYGVSGSGGTVTYGASSLTDSSLTLAVDVLAGGYVQVGGLIRRVLSNTADTLTLATPWGTTPAAAAEYEAWIPHYRDNPHSRTAGFGFRYPSSIPQPGRATVHGTAYSRPRGRLVPRENAVTGTAQSAQPVLQAGQQIAFAWDLAGRLGKRINMVHVAADSAGLTRSQLRGGAPNDIGWWTTAKYRDWVVNAPDGLAARLKLLLTVSLPAALALEGGTAKVVGVIGYQGETESGVPFLRGIYLQLLTAFSAWLQRLVHGAGLSMFSAPESLPMVHAQIGPTWRALLDTTDEINTAIRSWAAASPNTRATFSTDASQLGGDTIHFSGRGEAVNGALASAALAGLLDVAADLVDDSAAIAICNEALGHLGDKATVFSLDIRRDRSEQARKCALFYGRARDAVLEAHAWGFATRTVALSAVTPEAVRPQWLYAYALPADMAAALEVLPSASAVLPFNDTSGALELPTPRKIHYTIERQASGASVLLTNEADAVLRYTARVEMSAHLPRQFLDAVAWKLAAKLAGSLVKGEEGVKAAQRAEGMARFYIDSAAAVDAQSTAHPQEWVPDSIRARG